MIGTLFFMIILLLSTMYIFKIVKKKNKSDNIIKFRFRFRWFGLVLVDPKTILLRRDITNSG